jgi:hypothetical protein
MAEGLRGGGGVVPGGAAVRVVRWGWWRGLGDVGSAGAGAKLLANLVEMPTSE